MKNTDVGDNQSTRAGRRVRRRDRSRRAPRPVPPSGSRGVASRRSAGKPQDADGVSVWRSTPDGGLDAGAQTGAAQTGARSRNRTVSKDSWSRGVAKASRISALYCTRSRIQGGGSCAKRRDHALSSMDIPLSRLFVHTMVFEWINDVPYVEPIRVSGCSFGRDTHRAHSGASWNGIAERQQLRPQHRLHGQPRRQQRCVESREEPWREPRKETERFEILIHVREGQVGCNGWASDETTASSDRGDVRKEGLATLRSWSRCGGPSQGPGGQRGEKHRDVSLTNVEEAEHLRNPVKTQEGENKSLSVAGRCT